MSQTQTQICELRVRPLPHPNPFDTTQQVLPHSAYKICLRLEEHHATVLQMENGALSVLVCARLLGRMVLEAPTDMGRQNISTEIIRSLNDDQLQKLAQSYRDNFIRCCKSIYPLLVESLMLTPAYPVRSIKGRTPAPSAHISAPSFDAEIEVNMGVLQQTPSSHAAAKAQVCVIDQGVAQKDFSQALIRH